jgi:hypothetical protein
VLEDERAFNQTVRMLGYGSVILAALGDDSVPAGDLLYDSGVSPMGVMLAMRVPVGLRTENLRERVYQKLRPIPFECGAEIRQKALNLRKGGMPGDVVASIFNVPPGKLSAWLAHDTMGTYDK